MHRAYGSGHYNRSTWVRPRSRPLGSAQPISIGPMYPFRGACPQIAFTPCPPGTSRALGPAPCYTPQGSCQPNGSSSGQVATIPVNTNPQPAPRSWSGWGGNPPSAGSGFQISQLLDPNGAYIQGLLTLYQTNPSALTAQQLSQLQQSGALNSLLTAQASLTTTPSTTTAAATVSTNCSACSQTGMDFSSLTCAGCTVPWYLWAAAGVGVFLFMRKK